VQDTDGFPSVARGAATTASVAGFPWHRRQLCRGIRRQLSVRQIAAKLNIAKSTLYVYLRHRDVAIGPYQKQPQPASRPRQRTR
jgi:IS30 family transposase